MNEFQCVFCGEKIDNKKEKVTSILLNNNWENEEEQVEQQFFCHISCFKNACKSKKYIF